MSQIGATLATGAADYSLTSKTLDPVYTNLITDPSNEGTGSIFVGTNCTLDLNDTSWAAVGTKSVNIYSPTSTDSRFAIGGDSGAIGLGMVAGHTYTFAATGNVKNAMTTAGAGLSCYIAIYYRTAADGYTLNASPQIANVVGVPTRVSVTATLPADATEAFVRVYLGNTTGQIRWDAFTLVDVTANTADQPTAYFDGSHLPSTLDPNMYSVAWTGTANASTSTLTESPNTDATIWQPGTTAYDWLAPLVQTGNLRLWCDETRVWHLDTSATVNSTFLSLASGTNVTDATETISLTSGEWYTGGVVQYNWTDSAGLSHIQYDTAGTATNGRTFQVTYDDTVYPGPGAAAAILSRASNKGRQFSVTAMPNFTVTPTGALLINLPNDDIQSGITSAVTWNIPQEGDANMTVTSRGLVSVPANSWAAATDTWATSPTGSWATDV